VGTGEGKDRRVRESREKEGLNIERVFFFEEAGGVTRLQITEVHRPVHPSKKDQVGEKIMGVKCCWRRKRLSDRENRCTQKV